jgi:hypothetical protein
VHGSLSRRTGRARGCARMAGKARLLVEIGDSLDEAGELVEGLWSVCGNYGHVGKSAQMLLSHALLRFDLPLIETTWRRNWASPAPHASVSELPAVALFSILSDRLGSALSSPLDALPGIDEIVPVNVFATVNGHLQSLFFPLDSFFRWRWAASLFRSRMH